ncbi:TPA: IS30 family transposase, partial [Enterococcus faecium]|nr:IS30 family transposase [Enterococcus faecium]
MTYTHLTTDELVIIESYFKINQSVAKTAHCLNRSRQTIHKVYLFFKQGKSALEYYQQYKKNKSNCGRRPLVLPEEQSEYIQRKVVQGWTPDVIVGRAAFPISCSARTIYRMFKKGLFDSSDLPMKGKRKPNGHQERRGKQTFRRSIHERE